MTPVVPSAYLAAGDAALQYSLLQQPRVNPRALS